MKQFTIVGVHKTNRNIFLCKTETCDYFVNNSTTIVRDMAKANGLLQQFIASGDIKDFQHPFFRNSSPSMPQHEVQIQAFANELERLVANNAG